MNMTLITPEKPKQKYPDFGVWLTYAEAIHSETAILHGIKNEPNDTQYARMLYTYEHGYAPLCEHYGFKIPLNSFFRCEALNNIIPGASATSEHVHGGAFDVDMRRTPHPVTNNQYFEYIRTSGMIFDELIFESPDERNVPRWVHFAVRPDGNRGKILKMVRANGSVTYQHWPFRV